MPVKIAPLVVKYLRDVEGKEVYNDVIATKLKLTREQVRKTVRTMMRDHPEFGVRETSPYYYVYDSSQAEHPVSAVPHIPTYEELGGEVPPREYAEQMERIFAQDRAANPGKYPPATVGEYARTATKDDAMAMRVHAASVRAVNGEVEFHVVARKGDVVILADVHDALWAAKKL